MPRSKILGFLLVLISLLLIVLFLYSVFFISKATGENYIPVTLSTLDNFTFYAVALPIAATSLFMIGTGLWIGWTILTIKVVPPMPEIAEKKDHSKIKAFFLCLISLSLAVALIYGIYIRSFWSLAIPAGIISLIILGAIFWVGIAIITTRSTLHEKK